MKILIAHNGYQERGGEEAVVERESQLLIEHGHEVIFYRRHNNELQNLGTFSAVSAGISTVWAGNSNRALKELLLREEPDVVHFHNTFPLISPAAYWACSDANVPVIQTLHNYRLLCPEGMLLREGRICEACSGLKLPWPGVVHACYRDSHVATAAVAAMLTVHRAIGTWKKKVGAYIALSEFARSKFIEGGLPAERIVVKPNFAQYTPMSKTDPGDYVLFVGRLSPEKGSQLLIRAWKGLKVPIPLHVVGDGPLGREMREDLDDTLKSQIQMHGRCTAEEVASLMAGARCLVVPSITYESFPLSVVEAFSLGLPVLASRIGAIAEIVQDGVTGLHFEPGNGNDLAAKVEWAWTHASAMSEMGRAARAEYEARFTAEKNYQILMRIYEMATSSRCVLA